MSSNSSQHSIFHQYFVKGIIDSGIVEDGGYICDKQIPSLFKYTVVVLSLIFNIWMCVKIKRSYKFTIDSNKIKPSLFQKVYGVVSILIVLVQTYLKISTMKGIFILNPCHANLIFVAILALLPTTKNSKLIHLAWEPWIFGPIFALLFPHLYGIDQFEIFIYYFEHLLIFPFGQLLLTRRYGGTQFPSLKNQLFGFGTMAIYQYAVLTGVSDLTKVNLNFTLCHSPADASFNIWGHWYFLFGQIYLNIASYLFLIIMWPIKNIVYRIFFNKGVKTHTA